MPITIARIRKSLLRRTDEFLRTSRILSPWRIDRAVYAEEVAGDSIANLQVIAPADARVSLNTNAHDQPFLQVCKYFREGWYSRGNIFACEVPEALCHVGNGLVCTRDFEAIIDSQMKYRLEAGPALVGNKLTRPFRWFKPLRVRRLPGLYATIGNIYMRYWGHWVFDCLPRLYSLEKISAGRRVTLLVPDNLATSWRDSLNSVLPANFELQALPANSWVQVDRMLLASYPTGRANSHMPQEFYDYVRNTCFAKFGLSPENQPTERIYVSRAGTRHRRVVNEEALIKLLSAYGFKTVTLEKLNFRQQVELFHRAEIVIAADGSNWADMFFAGKIKICVLYSHHEPNMHWFTAAKGLGQEHYFMRLDSETQHSDFSVDLAEMKHIVEDQMGLVPVTAA